MPSLKELISSFKKVKDINYAQVMNSVDQALARFAEKQFMSQGAYGGKPWESFASEPKYLAFKRAIGASELPLRWKPGMERVYPALTNVSDPLRNFKGNNKLVTLDINIPYLASIEKGGVGPFGERFPGREIFPSNSRRLREDVLNTIKPLFYEEFKKVSGLHLKDK